MKRLMIAMLSMFAAAIPAVADSIRTERFAVNPADIMSLKTGQFDLFSSDLTGMVFTGQAMALNLQLADDLLARVRSTRFGVGLTIYTNAPSYPGFAESATGFLFDARNQALTGTMDAGRAEGSNGTTIIGLPFLSSLNGDLKGIHFDGSLPNSGYTVTNSRLRFSLYDQGSVEFGTAAQFAVPEPATWLLVFCGVAALALPISIRKEQ